MSVVAFDIETGPLEPAELEAVIPPFDREAVKIGNLKDPEKIDAKIVAAEQKHRQEFLNKAALSPITGRILAIGWYSKAPVKVAAHYLDVIDLGEEQELLTACWRRAEYHRDRGDLLVGHNIFGFDLPFLVRRCWHHSIPIPGFVFDQRAYGHQYWASSFVDTMQVWQCTNRQERIGLDSLAKFLGVGQKLEGLSGADFAQLFAADRDRAIEYLRRDVEITYRCARRMGIGA